MSVTGITIRVRMHPMHADFTKHVLEANKQGQVVASEKHPFGLLIKNLLRSQPRFPPKINYEAGSYVEFILPAYDDVNNEYRNYISENSERIIASKIRSRFNYELHEFVMSMKGSGLTEIRRIILLFCETMEISEESFKYNSLEREYKRYRDRLEIVKKTRKITSCLELFLSFICPLLVCYTMI